MKHLLYIFFATALFSSCSKEAPGNEPQVPQEPQPIQFRTFIEEDGKIRPMVDSDTRSFSGDPLSTGYYISCLNSSVDYPTTVNYDRLMWNVEMNKDGSYKSSTPKYFWSAGSSTLRHTFVAYSAAPSGSTGGATISSLAGGTSSQPALSVSYTNADDPTKQIDFLHSDNSKNVLLTTYAPSVNLIFRHRFTRVMYKLTGPGGVTLSECQAKITYKTNAVRKAGTVFLGNDATINFSSNYHTGTYTLGSSFSLPGSATTTATAVDMGDMILMPQQTLAEGWASLTLTYTPDGTTQAQNLTVDLPALSLSSTAGQQINILLAVMLESKNLSVTDVSLTDWNSKSGDIDVDPSIKHTKPNPPSDAETLVINGLRWAKGNLIAVDEANCKLGSPATIGLYFKYGSLVGWSDGSSIVIKTMPSRYNGATIWAGVTSFNATKDVPIPTTDNPQTGIGDPCRLYLGEPWRTPTLGDFNSLKYSSWTSYSGINGTWGGTTTTGGNVSSSLFFPAAGRHRTSDGAIELYNTQGGYLAATFHGNYNNAGLWLRAEGSSMDNWDRRAAYPVRCVRPL